MTDGVPAQTDVSQAIENSLFSAFGNILAASGDSVAATGDIRDSIFLAGYDIGGNLKLDGLAGAGSDDIKGDPTMPVQIGNVSATSDIVASFFASGIGTDNAIVGDGVVDALDDFVNAPGSSIGDVTATGVIAGGRISTSSFAGSALNAGGVFIDIDGFDSTPLSIFSSDHIGVLDADAIGMSDTNNATVASVGINAEFAVGVMGDIAGINAHTGTRDQAIGDGMLVTTGTSLGFLTASNLSGTAVSAIGTGHYGSIFIENTFIGDITASTPNSAGAVAIDGRGSVGGGSRVEFLYSTAIGNILVTSDNLPDAVSINKATFGENLVVSTDMTIGTVTSRGSIVNSEFSAPHDIANVVDGDGITVEGNIIQTTFTAGDLAGLGSLAANGGINVGPLAGQQGYISGSTFIGTDNDAVRGLTIGNIAVSGRIETDAGHVAGAAILDSHFITETILVPPPALHIGSIRATAGSVEDSTFFAFGNIALTGGIFVYGNSLHKDYAISDASFNAGSDIGSITIGPSGLAKDVVGNEIRTSVFAATNIAFGIDDQGTPSTADDTPRAIVIHGSNTDHGVNRTGGVDAEAGLSIFDTKFTAGSDPGVGSIGDVLIAQSPGDDSGGGIAGSAAGSLTDPSTFSTHFFTNFALGKIEINIHVTDATQDVSAIANTGFKSQSIVAVSPTEVHEYGQIDDVVAKITGLPSTKDVITNSTFNAGREGVLLTAESPVSFGNITATTEGSGEAVSDSVFRSGGTMGSLTLESGSHDNDAVTNALFSAYASIGPGFNNEIGVVGNVVDSKFLAGYDVAADLQLGAGGDLINTQSVATEKVQINRVSVDGNFIASDLIAGINPGSGLIFGDSLPLALDAKGNPLPPPAQNDTVAAKTSFIGTVQVEGGIFVRHNDQKLHAIESATIEEFQQPSGESHIQQLPGFLDNGGVAVDVKIAGSPSGAPVFLTSRDFGGRVVDFNLDGNPDLILLDRQTGTLRIFLGNGDGVFDSNPEVFAVGAHPVGVVIGNLDGAVRRDTNGNILHDANGKEIPVLDIVVLNGDVDTRLPNVGSNTIDVFFGDPITGLFSDTASTHVTENLHLADTLTSIAASDWVSSTNVQGDHFLDLAITDSSAGTVLLFKNDGTGRNFTANEITDFKAGSSPTGISATLPLYDTKGTPDAKILPGLSLNGQGGADVVVADATTPTGTISVLFGNTATPPITPTGNGQFSAATSYNVGDTPVQTVLADVDGDGDVDILVVNFASNDVTVLLNNGAGIFSTVRTIAVGTAPRSIAVGDFNGDGKVDFATANASPGSDDVSIVLNDFATGTFQDSVAVNLDTHGAALSITSADYDGKNLLDLAVTNTDNPQAPVVLINDGTGTFTVI